MNIPGWHSFFVHFTVALSCAALLFMVLSRFAPKEVLRQQWRHSARWTLWLGAFCTLFTLLSGFQEYHSATGDELLLESMAVHRNWALVSSAFFVLMVFWSISCCQRGRMAGYGFLVAMMMLVAMVIITARSGVELVHPHGLGAISQPVATDSEKNIIINEALEKHP